MAKILTHTDDDGMCAAAISILQIIPTGIGISPEDIQTYNYSGELNIPEFHENEYVVITDLALDDVIFKYIESAVNARSHVIHIDHHISTFKWLKSEERTSAEKNIISNIKPFYDISRSASMLAYIYSSAPDDIKGHTMDYMINDNSTSYILGSEYDGSHGEAVPAHKIPYIVKYIDDYDTHDPYSYQDPQTRLFHYGFESIMKHPLDNIWAELLYDYSGILTDEYINQGSVIYERESKRIKINAKKNAFETTCFNIPAICLNTIGTSVEISEELYNKYPIIIIYHYNGYHKKWKYSIYNNSKIHYYDVSKIAEYFGGGGHKAAAGFMTTYDIFSAKSGKRYEWHTKKYASL